MSSSRISRLTAIRPISASGWRTVVSAGVTIAASSRSSKPTIERSSGMRTPRARAVCIAPIAMLSLNEKIAVGGSGRSSSCSAAEMPPEISKLPSTSSTRVGHEPRRRERGVVAAPAVFGRLHAARAGDRGDARVPDRQQVLHRLVGARGMGGGDGGDALVQRHHRVDHDEAVAVVQQRRELVARFLGEDHQRAVGGAVHQPLEERDLSLVLVHRRAEDEAHVLLVERLGGAADELREVGVVDHRHRGADQSRPAA